MTPSGKDHGELVKLYYQNVMNATEALLAYRLNHLQRRDPCTSQDLLDFIQKFGDTGYNWDKPRSEWPTVSEDVIKEVHHIVTSRHMQTTTGTARG